MITREQRDKLAALAKEVNPNDLVVGDALRVILHVLAVRDDRRVRLEWKRLMREFRMFLLQLPKEDK